MYQKVMLVGNLGGDPELRYTPKGDAVTSFSLATNRKWKNSDGTPGEETCWFQVSVWGRQAEACNQYLAKGRQVFVEGRLIPDSETGGPRIWTDASGNPRASFSIRAIAVQFLGGGSNKPPDEVRFGDDFERQGQDTVDEDEIPF